MDSNRQSMLVRHAVWAIAVLYGIGLCIWLLATQLLSANRAADYSAHAALTKEICLLLAAVPPGQPYPESLTDTALTFPDGGDESLLDRFEYHSTGTSCTLKTVLKWDEINAEVISRSFPADSANAW
jgi:hypothetical protein